MLNFYSLVSLIVESLPSVGDFDHPVASRPITYPYQIHTVSGMGHDVMTPPTDDNSGQQRKKKLKRKQRSNASTQEGKRPPALRRRSQTSSAPAVHEEHLEKNVCVCLCVCVCVCVRVCVSA